MRRLIIFLIFLMISVWLGVEFVKHPGYLLLVYKPWIVQMPLWFALVSTIVILALFYLLIHSVDSIQLGWFRLKNWLRFRREHKFYSKTQNGLTFLIEGRFQKAEKLLLAGVNQSVDPLINYLGAAKAAHELGEYDKRDGYLQKAYQVAPDADLAIGITSAELEIEQHQLEHAAATLLHLHTSYPRHPRILKLLEKVYVRQAEWENVLKILPAMRKAKIINSEQYAQFEKNIYCSILNSANLKNLDTLHTIWNSMPKHVRKNSDVVCAYTKQLLRFPVATKEAEELIRKTLKAEWNAELVKIYSMLPFSNLNRQLVIVGAWVKLYGQRPELLLLLGKLCAQIQLWGKAKDYFDKCLMQGPNTEASLEYGKLLEHLDEPHEALNKYREGLAQSIYSPMPTIMAPIHHEPNEVILAKTP